MFRKILIANRGEIAVRVIRACRELGITAVSLYDPSDISSLHVRLADECVSIASPAVFSDAETLIAIARAKGADAIHPGYGFLAEEAAFAQSCAEADITFIGPSAEVLAHTRNKLAALARVSQAGFNTVIHSTRSFGPDELELLTETAAAIGYPVVLKSCSGGRGRGTNMVATPERLEKAMSRSLAASYELFHNRRVYVEKGVMPAHLVGVQILGDQTGHIIHLGERQGVISAGSKKLLEESPAPCLQEEQRRALWETAVAIARLFHYQNAGTVEFVVDGDGRFYFSEIKARIQVDHPATEMRSRIDLFQTQMKLAAGETLPWPQADIQLAGWAMTSRIQAEDPAQAYMPSPGQFWQVRLPGGPETRVDTYIHSQSEVPGAYAPLIAKVTTWGADRAACWQRMKCALEECVLMGTQTNLSLLQQVLQTAAFKDGLYASDYLAATNEGQETAVPTDLRDVAVAAAILYVQRQQQFTPQLPPRLLGGWHRASRYIP